MQIKILGPLSAEANGNSIVPTAGKPRQVLSLMALHPGRVIPVPTLMEELWDTAPPVSALTTLQTYIQQLRRKLGTAMGPASPAGARDVLATRYGGYLLQIDDDCVDVHQYEKLLREGQSAFEAGDNEVSAARFRAALDLWTGAPLVDVKAGPVLGIEVRRLQESRLVAVERRIDADLRLGRHAELIAELTDLTARHPHHEGLYSQAMLALYRSGRQASALETYRRLQRGLVEALGVEPSPQLQRMHQAILSADPLLDVLSGPCNASTFDLFAA
ncbi:BTAD domain-containing putative transcriptional regulator [Streptomyces sp. NPDC048612]|uniref:AfsR/SARP family transcriptional regulator n=1 Tax=Streptomyces sp. NPDC048612 TaxID=3365579 RepID=UPI00371D5694